MDKTELYGMWLRVRDDMQESVDRLQREVMVNRIFLRAVIEELAKYPKPKEANPVKQLTG